MHLKKIQDIDLTNKRVLVRADFNVSLDKNGQAKETYKIQAVKETIDYILSHEGATVAIMSHLGRPTSQDDTQFSLSQLKDELQGILKRPVAFACSCIGVCVERTLNESQQGQVILLENLRFHEGEKQNDEVFAGQLATAFDIHVNDAFSVAHRAHASVHAIAKFIPSYAGIWLVKEVEMLTKAKLASERPSVAIIGGSKIQTKLPLIATLEKPYTTILVGGRTSIEAIDQKISFSDKVILPSDFNGEDRFDIGQQTIDQFVSYINSAKLIVWNGPLGKFEQPPYDKGTKEIAQAIAQNKQAFSVVGGGESVQAIRSLGYEKDISFISTGGGAMLAFMAAEPMPGLEVLQSQKE